MPRLGITGHMNLAEETARLVHEAIRSALAEYAGEELIGVSCLAAGADSLFAQAVVDAGGTLEVILPSADYRQTKVKPDHAGRFDSLISRAVKVRVMPYAHANRDAYEAANDTLVRSCERLFAVWDGEPSADKGGTADVVAYARSRGVPVVVVWPDSAQRRM